MIFPAYVQGGWPQLTPKEINNLASQIYDIGKSYTPRCFLLDTSYYTLLAWLELKDATKYVKEEAHRRRDQ